MVRCWPNDTLETRCIDHTDYLTLYGTPLPLSTTMAGTARCCELNAGH
jgi:hypothetical protein